MVARVWSSISSTTLACTVVLTACGAGAEDSDGTRVGVLPEGHPPVEQGAPAVPSLEGPVAVVLETMDAAGYTYARVESNGDEIWTAGPQAPLSPGDSIVLAGAMGMTDFTSTELGRTFETILFLNAFRPPVSTATPPQQRGTVRESLEVQGYTYVHVDSEGASIWIAGPRTAVGKGETVAWTDGPVMRNFESPTLGRTFEAIVFAGTLTVIE